MKSTAEALGILVLGLSLELFGGASGHLFCHKDRWVYSVRAEDEMATVGFQVDILRSPDTVASCSTKCQMHDDCMTFAFDPEDFKCQLINEAVLEENDLVSVEAEPDAEGYRVFQPDCGDGSKGGWWLTFKAGRGTGRTLFDDFDTDGAINDSPDVIQVRDVGNKALYHSADLDNWGIVEPVKFVDVELRLYNNLGEEILAMRFDAIGYTKKTFFSPDNLLYHPWTDDPTTGTFFYDLNEDAMGGFPENVTGSFGITDSAQGGWMVVLENTPSWSLVQVQPPAFLYALPGGPKVIDWEQALSDGTAEVAAAFAIFVR